MSSRVQAETSDAAADTEHVLALLRTLVERDEAGESDDDERAERSAGADDDEELARSLADCCNGEHGRSGERRGGENREPLPAEPLLRIRVRLGELHHRRVQRRGAPENRCEHEEEVDGVADAVPAVQRPEPVERVTGELEDESGRDHGERRRAKTGAEHHPRSQGDEQDVHHRERERDRRAERARVVGERRMHQERPADERDADGDDARVDQARPVAAGDLLPDHHEQRRGENDVRAKSEVVRGGRERDPADRPRARWRRARRR